MPERRTVLGRPGPSIRKQRWRDRQRRGVMVVPVEISASTLDFIVETHWLRDDDAANLSGDRRCC